MEGPKSGKQKEALLTNSKYAIHTRTDEAFGISVAEMVNAGCIPFVPNGGGPTEIVPFRELQFGTVEEAVRKIDFMLGNEEARRQMLTKLKEQEGKFSIERFCERARQIVDSHLFP